MLIERAVDKKVYDVLNELNQLPKAVIRLIQEYGTKIYYLNKKYPASWIGLIEKGLNASCNRKLNEVSCHLSAQNALVILTDCMHEIDRTKEQVFSVTLHELGHAFDMAAGCKFGYKDYLSIGNLDIQKRFNKGKGLDWYANTTPMEYFAQAFMAYFMQGKERYIPVSYREHRQEDLKEHDPDMFYFLDNLIRRELNGYQ